MALLVKYGVIGAQPWHCVAYQPGATHFLDKGQAVFLARWRALEEPGAIML